MPKSICGERKFSKITQKKVANLLHELKAHGATVSGPAEGPWNIDVSRFGIRVKLYATWNESTEVLTIIVTDKSSLISCGRIWGIIEDAMNSLRSYTDEELPTPV